MKNPIIFIYFRRIFQRCELWRDDLVGRVFYEDGFFGVEDAGGEVRGGVDDSERYGEFAQIRYSNQYYFISFSPEYSER